QEVLSEDEETMVIRNINGAVVKTLKNSSNMPQFISFPVTSKKDFYAIKERYNPNDPERRPPNWKDIVISANTGEYPVWGPAIGSVGLYSMIRTWMGTESACTIFYDDPALAQEMVEFIVDFTIEAMRPVFADIKLDYFLWWEDFSFKNGPLVSPDIFKEFLLPGYRKVNDFLNNSGIDIIMLDTDGDPIVLIPLLLQAGINCLLPLEQCIPNMSPVSLRKEFGHELLLCGGVDKRALAKSKKEIDEELISKLPLLLRDGGYIPHLDHLAPPDIPYENWLYYLEKKKQICEGNHG
ncbi:MAG: hypothetical protein HY350_01240, partial [Candidatus Omnitrophica bacterium]|nr:hypothetical protein [Candidatus Omnitrophota bacterium]